MKNKLSKVKRLTLVTAIALVGLFLSLAYLAPQSYTTRADWSYASGYNPHGGYLDRITYVVYPSEDQAQALLALQAGQVYGFDERVPADSVPDLEATAGVEVTSELGVIYRQFTLNCEKFPTNMTGYRLAVAYALDKFAVTEASTGGYAEPMDGPIPLPIVYWEYDSQMASHFYNKDIAAANASLDAAGFIATNSPDGYRYYDVNDNGDYDAGVDLDSDAIAIEGMASAGYDPAIQAVLIAFDGLDECGIKGTMVEVNFDALIDALESGDFWLGCFSWNINPPGEPDLLYDFFYSSAPDNRFFYRYNNSEYDYNVTQMMSAPTKLEARNWAWNCSKILMEEMPMVVCYNDAYINAYRTDIWEGYVNMAGVNRMQNNKYTFHQLRLKESAGGPYGSCYPLEYICVLSEGMDTTNIIMSDSGYTSQVMQHIYDELWTIDPITWAKEPNLAYNWTIEPTVASGDIQDGQLFTFYLYENVTWHDGEAFTSEDVEYSFGTIWQYGPYDYDLVENIYKIETPDDYTVEIYTNQSGYFEFSRATSLSILPKHIWEPHFNFTAWVPTTPSDMTGTSSMKWVTRVPGQYVILERNADWHFGLESPDRPPCAGPINIWLYVGIGVVVIVIIIIAGVYFFRIRK